MSNNNYHISVIVPVYNAENVLAQGLGNLLNQTKKEIEIILVNDASKDGSLKICQDAKSAFGDRVVIIDKPKNEGPGAARNDGIEIASGDYIGFMDADDLVDTTMYEKLYEEAVSQEADITDCAFYNSAKDMASIHISDECVGNLNAEKKSILIISGGYIWSKLFKRQLLMDNNIRFRAVYALEDMDFLIDAIIHAKKAANITDILYHYRDNGGSLSKQDRLDEYFDINISALEAIHQRAFAYEEYESVRLACEYAMACLYKNAIVRVLADRKPGREKIYIDMLEKARRIRRRDIISDIETNPYVKGKLDKSDLAVISAVDASVKKALLMAK